MCDFALLPSSQDRVTPMSAQRGTDAAEEGPETDPPTGQRQKGRGASVESRVLLNSGARAIGAHLSSARRLSSYPTAVQQCFICL